MSYALTRRGFALATAATATLFATAPHAFAQALTLTDITGAAFRGLHYGGGTE